jgi:hypothetical protein
MLSNLPGKFRLPLILLIVCSTISADDRYNPVEDSLVIEECGACHMVFQPQMLPQKSWQKIMANLEDHFGEDASLDPVSISHIENYLLESAADANWFGGKFMRGLSGEEFPLRITETPYWVREHNEEVPLHRWNDPKVNSKSNCVVCHSRANRGDYDD